MGYRLGVDLGTTFTAAAVDDGAGPRMVGLGNRALQVPSVLFLQRDGSWLCGEPAERRSATEPDRAVREFKRRLGDTVPMLVAGQPFSPQALTAALLRWVVATVSERQGGAPDGVVLTRPANWGGFKQELFAQVGPLADLAELPSGVVTCTEPEAAATQYASRAQLEPGARVVVYDLGGGTFDVCVLEKREVGFSIVGAPDGVEHLGGIDFDEAVFRHVLGSLGERAAGLDPEDGEVTAGLVRLRRDCVEAKEALSTDVESVVPVALPGVVTSVRLTRAELEELIGPAVRETLAATRRALRSSATVTEELAAVVLVGGSSRIPLVSQLLQSELGVRTAMDTHPKHDIALGAVLHRTPSEIPDASPPSSATASATATEWPTRDAGTSGPAPEHVAAATTPQVVAPASGLASDPGPGTSSRTADLIPKQSDVPARDPRSRPRIPLTWVAGAATLAVVVAAGLWWMIDGSADDPEADSPEGPTAASPQDEPSADTSAIAATSLVVPLDLGDGGGLYVVAEDGSSERLERASGEAPGLPSLSPDRRFVYYRTGTSQDDYAQWVLDLETDADRLPMLTGTPSGVSCPGRPAFNPRAESEVALLCRVGNEPARYVYLGTAAGNGQISDLKEVPGLARQEFRAITYTDRGDLVLTHDAEVVDDPGVYVYTGVSPGGVAGRTRLTSEDAEDSAGSPVDGRIAYRSEGRIQIVAQDGSAVSLPCREDPEIDEVTNKAYCVLAERFPDLASHPSWSPTGDQLVFAVGGDLDEGEPASLVKMDLTSGEGPVPIESVEGKVVGPPAWAHR